MDFSKPKPPGHAYFELLVNAAGVSATTILKWLSRCTKDQLDFYASRELNFNTISKVESTNRLIEDRKMIGFGHKKKMENLARAHAVSFDANCSSQARNSTTGSTHLAGVRVKLTVDRTDPPTAAAAATSHDGDMDTAGTMLVPNWHQKGEYNIRGPLKFGFTEWTTDEAKRRVVSGRTVKKWAVGEPIIDDKWFSYDEAIMLM